MVLEGGSIDVNGAGTALATEECLLDPVVQPRNPGMDRGDVERAFEAYLGVDNIIWLGAASPATTPMDTSTTSHVSSMPPPSPPPPSRTPPTSTMLRWRTIFAVCGRPGWAAAASRWYRCRCPGRSGSATTLPASYLNFYIANGLVLVPTFNDPADRVALGRLAELFPRREVIGIHAVDLVLGLGTLHCLTLQEPVA